MAFNELNSFGLEPVLGLTDQRFNYNTTPCQVDISQATPILQGQAVKVVDSAGGVPKVVACAADSDDVFGFVNFSAKNSSYVAGRAVEISQDGNVLYLIATNSIPRGSPVQLETATVGGVAAMVGGSGADIVGYAMDKGTASSLIRVKLKSPSFLKA